MQNTIESDRRHYLRAGALLPVSLYSQGGRVVGNGHTLNISEKGAMVLIDRYHLMTMCKFMSVTFNPTGKSYKELVDDSELVLVKLVRIEDIPLETDVGLGLEFSYPLDLTDIVS